MGLGNFLQGLAPAIDPNSQLAVAPLAMPQTTPLPNLPAPRERRSILDTVGRVADVFARVGGADPQFQQLQDASLARTNAAEDRTRAIDLDGLKRQLVEQQVASGSMEAATAENTRLGQAVRGLRAIQARGGDVNAAWPLLAQQAGIPQERAQILAQAFQQDPNAVEGLHAELNGEGSFGLQLRYANDAQGNTRPYVTGKDGQAHFIDLPAGMTAADPAGRTVNLGGTTAVVGANSGRVTRILPNTERPGAAADRTSRERIAAGGNETRRYVADTRPNATRGGRGGGGGGEGGDLTNTQRGAVRQTYEAIPGITRTLDRVNALSGQMEREGTMASGFLGGRVPGALSGKTAGEFDKAQSLLMAQIRTLIRTTGEGSMSDYESRLNAAVSPARTDSAAGRTEAIRNLRGLLTEIRGKSERLLGTTTPGAPRRTGTLTAPAPRRTVTPSTGRGGNGGWSIVSAK